jgi:hypothetical protein
MSSFCWLGKKGCQPKGVVLLIREERTHAVLMRQMLGVTNTARIRPGKESILVEAMMCHASMLLDVHSHDR